MSTLVKRDVLLIDEADTVSPRQISGGIIEAEQRGSKIVIVGAPEQFQLIGAGAFFRVIAERLEFAYLQTTLSPSIR